MSLNVARSEQSVSTSMIVPVWLSTTTNPLKEKLVYALLDTQSNTVFIHQDVTHELQADVCPVKLKLTTMMGRNAVVSSGKVSDLLVRGYNSATVINSPLHTQRITYLLTENTYLHVKQPNSGDTCYRL